MVLNTIVDMMCTNGIEFYCRHNVHDFTKVSRWLRWLTELILWPQNIRLVVKMSCSKVNGLFVKRLDIGVGFIKVQFFSNVGCGRLSPNSKGPLKAMMRKSSIERWAIHAMMFWCIVCWIYGTFVYMVHSHFSRLWKICPACLLKF